MPQGGIISWNWEISEFFKCHRYSINTDFGIVSNFWVIITDWSEEPRQKPKFKQWNPLEFYDFETEDVFWGNDSQIVQKSLKL